MNHPDRYDRSRTTQRHIFADRLRPTDIDRDRATKLVTRQNFVSEVAPLSISTAGGHLQSRASQRARRTQKC